MKSSVLLFRSLAIIIFIAGGAHLFNYLSPNQTSSIETNSNLLKSKNNIEEKSVLQNKAPLSVKDITGKWKVVYNSEEFKGSIIYNLINENNLINAYTWEYQDENGNREKAANEIALIIQKFDGSNGKGSYNIMYEGKKYDVDCEIKIINKTTFELSYDYYGYGDTETWKKL